MNQDVFDTFRDYLHERNLIRIRKENGEPKLTSDPILQKYKFTNILRSNDRTTKWVVENWYTPNRDKHLSVQALNCAIFRYFGCIEFAEAIGYQEEWCPEFLIDTAKTRMANKQKVFTGAYIITNGGIKAPKYEVVVGNYLQPFREQVPTIVQVAQDTNSWEAVSKIMRTIPGMGAFMTKEILLDMMLTPVLENATDKLTWSPVGPGAIRGLNRLHDRPLEKSVSQDKGLAEMKDLLTLLAAIGFEAHMPRIGVDFGITDIQFSLCELDKYLRVKNGEGRPRSKYRPTKE